MTYKVGITEQHGIADEYSKFAPEGYEYKFIDTVPNIYSKIFPSTAKRFFYSACDKSVDIVEAPIFPTCSEKPWIYTPAEFSGTANFSFLKIPIPRKIKLKLIESVLTKKNFKNIIFKSYAGLNSLSSYAGEVSPILRSKAKVVYPCISIRENKNVKPKDTLNILFVGDFFRKGGANVVDAFYQLYESHPYAKLQIIGNTAFDSLNTALKEEYHKKILAHPAIEHKMVKRDELLTNIYPNADIFVSPTYQETFGFAILEAMSFGLPVISTEHFAIPEIIEQNNEGFLIKTNQFDFIRDFKGYEINQIPKNFSNYMTEQVFDKLNILTSSPELRLQISQAAIHKVKTKFSPQSRALNMKPIYESALG